jgi:hypothetical protein
VSWGFGCDAPIPAVGRAGGASLRHRPIEGVASVVIIWRFTGARALSHAAEERAQKLVAIQFFLLAPYVTFEAVQHLASAERPAVSVLGMVLTATSLVGMPATPCSDGGGSIRSRRW